MNNLSFGELCAAARTGGKSLAQGEFLFRKGEAATHLYTVLDGCVRLVRFSWEGDPVVMHTACTGDGLAEASLFSATYHCDAEAMLPSTVACYDKKAIVAILRDSPESRAAGLINIHHLKKHPHDRDHMPVLKIRLLTAMRAGKGKSGRPLRMPP